MLVDWLGALAACIAAVASVAVLWNQVWAVQWEVEAPPGKGARYQLMNVGRGTARHVHLWVDVPGEPKPEDAKRVVKVQTGEGIPFAAPLMWRQAGVRVNVSWRGFVRRRTWSRSLN